MTVRQAAKRLEVSRSTVYALIASGKLKCVRIGLGRGCIRVLDEHIDEFLRGAEPIATPPPDPTSRPRLKHIRLG
jgi:excisionase family DNA binding protein